MRPLYTARDLTTDAYNYSSQEAIVVLTALSVENKIWGKKLLRQPCSAVHVA